MKSGPLTKRRYLASDYETLKTLSLPKSTISRRPSLLKNRPYRFHLGSRYPKWIPSSFAPFEWLPLDEFGTVEEANLLAAAVAGNPEIDCDVLFQYCDLREVYEPLEYLNVALQYDAVPYRKWSSPLNLREIGMEGLGLHEKCALQLGWELAGEDAERDRANMSVEELIGLGENEAEDRELVVWLQGYMDPYEGKIDTTRYSKEEIVERVFS